MFWVDENLIAAWVYSEAIAKVPSHQLPQKTTREKLRARLKRLASLSPLPYEKEKILQVDTLSSASVHWQCPFIQMASRLDLNALDLSTKTIPVRASIGTYMSSTVINAPATSVWRAVINTDTWPIWNRFCPGATIREQSDTAKNNQSRHLQLGTKMTIHINWNPRGPKKKPMDVGLVVTEFDPPRDGQKTPARIAWATDPSAEGFPAWLLYAERVTDFYEFKEGDGDESQRVTQVVSWESQRGLLAYVVKWFMGKKFRRCLKVQADDMTSFVEVGKA